MMQKKMAITELVFELQLLQGKIRGVFKGYTVAIVTCYVNKMTITCLPMLRHSFGANYYCINRQRVVVLIQRQGISAVK